MQFYILGYLKKYKENPTLNWMEKDLAVNLMIALGYRGYTPERGVVVFNSKPSAVLDNINVEEFLRVEIIPELSVSIKYQPEFRWQSLLVLLPEILRSFQEPAVAPRAGDTADANECAEIEHKRAAGLLPVFVC